LNHHINTSANQKDMPAVKANGININYEIQGSGEPLVLIMGLTAPYAVWEDHANFWSQHYQCILFDNRGVGLSDKPAGAYSSEMMADDTAGLMDALGIESAKVVGVSMGSIIAQSLAIRHPQKVKAMVLMCPWASCDRRGEAIFRHIMTIKARLRPEEFMHYIQFLIFSKSTWDNDEEYQGFLDGQKEASIGENPQPLHGLEGQALACINHNVVKELANVNIPSLVIGGKQDEFVPEWMALEVAGALPNSDLHLYDNAGHAFHWEKIDDFNPRVLEWLKMNGA